MPFRHQPPVHSPITSGALARSFVTSLLPGHDPVERLTDDLRSEYAADQVVLCGSGTQALQLAIETATESTDSIVALPAYSCYDVATAAIGADRRIALYDLDPVTLGPDLDSLAEAFRAGARAAVISTLYGVPIPWEPVQELADEHGVTLVEDAAQGHGASWRGKRLGSLAGISILSFGRGKGWTGGGGGALLIRGAVRDHESPLLASEIPRGTRLAAAAAIQWLLARPALFGIPSAIPGLGLGETRYKDPTTPANLPVFAASLLAHTRSAAASEAEFRRRAAREYAEALAQAENARLVNIRDEGEPGYLRFPIRVPGDSLSVWRSERARRLGVAPGYPAILASLEVVRSRLQASPSRWPGAEDLVRDLITLPTHSKLAAFERREIFSLPGGILQYPSRFA